MREEITTYEGAETMVTKIKCDSCEQVWDTDDDEPNYLVLDAVIEEESYSGWDERNSPRWNGMSLSSVNAARMAGRADMEYCDSCLPVIFADESAARIEEPDYYVEEETKDRYYCDFCADEIGGKPDHEVSLNPRIEVEKRVWNTNNVLNREKVRDVIAERIGEEAPRPPGRSRNYAMREEVHDCCHDCASRIFDTGSLSALSWISERFKWV